MEERKETNVVYSKRVKAGKRTYFFDVKATRANDYYLTITESRKKLKTDGDRHLYEKSKIFLYKEDLNKFVAALSGTAEHMKQELMPGYDFDLFADNNTEEDAPNSAINKDS